MFKHLFFLASFVLIFSCRKDEPVPDNYAQTCPVEGHTQNSYNSIIVGDTENVEIYGPEYIETSTTGYITKHSIDLLNDCSNDIKLYVDLTTNEQSIYFINESGVSMHEENPSRFNYEYEELEYYDFTGGVEAYSSICRTNILGAIPATDSVEYFESAPHYFQLEDMLTYTEFVSTNFNVKLWQNGQTMFEQVGFENDTLYFESVKYTWNYLPQQSDYRYIVFSYNSHLGLKYGWIKLAFTSPAEMSIEEYALQR